MTLGMVSGPGDFFNLILRRALYALRGVTRNSPRTGLEQGAAAVNEEKFTVRLKRNSLNRSPRDPTEGVASDNIWHHDSHEAVRPLRLLTLLHQREMFVSLSVDTLLE